MDNRTLGIIIALLGVAGMVIGLAVFSGALSWFGRLPGDIRIEHENVRVYVPLVSMLLVSVGLSAVIALARRLF
jgi:hypothetical protein